MKFSDSMPDDTAIFEVPGKVNSLLRKRAHREPQKCGDERKEWPLTDSQTEVYLECVNGAEGTMYNNPICCELPSDIDMERFQKAVKKAVSMHPAFGITVVLSGGMLVMQLCSEYLEAIIEEIKTQEIESAKRDFVRCFRLGEEPFYRIAICSGQEHSYFLFDAHYMIFDRASLKVFLDEISLLYNGEKPEPEEISLMDMSVYEERVKNTLEYQAARDYFKKYLDKAKTEDGLLKNYKSKLASAKSGISHMAFPDTLSCMVVEQFTKEKGISENTLFLGAFAYLLGKYTGRNKSLFCTSHSGRHTAKMMKSVGMFARMLPIYREWDERSSVEEYLREFQESFYETIEYDIVPFGELVWDHGISPDILFAYQGDMLSGLSLDGKQYPAQALPTGETRTDISVMIIKRQGSYEAIVNYRMDLYREETVEDLQGMLVQTLRGMLICETLGQIPFAAGSGSGMI